MGVSLLFMILLAFAQMFAKNFILICFIRFFIAVALAGAYGCAFVLCKYKILWKLSKIYLQQNTASLMFM